MKIFNLAIVAALAFTSCGNTAKLSGKQGIEGRVIVSSGNRMPSPDRPAPTPKGVKTTLYVYELTNVNQVTRQGNSTFYNSISTKMVSNVESDVNGMFKVSLPPGWYSLFVKKDTLFYSNWFDEKNNIAPVEVVADKMTNVDFKLDFNATH